MKTNSAKYHTYRKVPHTLLSCLSHPDNLPTILKYHIYSAGQVVDTSESYQTTFETDEEYQEFLNMTQSTSLYNTGVEVTTADTIVTLSTCTSASDNHRFVVRGVKEEETKQ